MYDDIDTARNVWIDVPAVPGLEDYPRVILQGVEPAIFLLKKPKLQCVSLGPTYENAHSINEALNVDTVKPMMKVLTKILFRAGEL